MFGYPIKRRIAAVLPTVLAAVIVHGWMASGVIAQAPGDTGLIPCVAVAADNTPVFPSAVLPSAKQISVAFRLKPDESAKTLNSQWIALDEGNHMIAENNLDLDGQKSGWLRLILQQPAPAGNYRLDTKLDGKAWQSVKITVVPSITQGAAEKPADLIPLNEGTSTTYDMLVMPGPGTKIEVPGATAGADGSIRGTMTLAVGKKEDAGTAYHASINDKPLVDMWVRLDDGGLMMVRQKPLSGGAGGEARDVNPPEPLQPLPATLEHGIEWTIKSKTGGDQKLQLFGPLMLDGPAGAAPGYIIFSDEMISVGAAGTSAARGRETVERQYLPKVGLIKEVRVSTLGGKLTSRNELSLPSSMPYKIVEKPEMRGRLGRVQFAYPPDTKINDAKIAVYPADAKPEDKPAQTGYGAASFDLLPGKYQLAINGKRVPVEVKSAHETTPRVGVVRINASKDTHFRILDTDKKTQLHAGYGTQDVALPAGAYFVEIAGGTEPITVTDGKVVEF
jgi:hypothetical protein